MTLRSPAMKSSSPSWPGAYWGVAAFLGGLSFTGFYFLPTWLWRPLFFLTPVVGPFVLLATGVVALVRARNRRDGAARRRDWSGLVVAAFTFVLVAFIDLLLFVAIPYIGPIVALIAFPLHYVCVVTFAMGVAAVLRADGDARAPRLVVPPIVGLLAGFALVFLRFAIVPRSTGVFLKAFSGSGVELRLPRAPLEPHGQRDLADTLGVYPRSLHEPIVALGDDSLWTASRGGGGDCPGHWIQRRGLSVDAPEWRRCLASERGVVRNLTGMALDASEGLLVVGFDLRDNQEAWWMRRFDAQGRDDERWSKAFPPETKIDRTYGALVDRDGSVYVFGESGSVDSTGT